MMRLSVFWGCRILTTQYAYEMSLRQVLPKLEVDLVDLKDVSCCGDPVRSISGFAATHLAARNLALAKETGLKDLLVPCNRCHLTLCEAKRHLDENEELRGEIDSLLNEEGLKCTTDIRIFHVIDLLHDVVKLKTIKGKVKKPLKGLRLASHPGCQIIRPSEIGRVDDSENPRKLDELVEVLGAKSVDFSEKLDCCGNALLFSHPDTALTLAGSKIKAIQGYGVDGLIDSCPSCHMMFDERQKDAEATVGGKLSLPVLYYIQLLGIAMGIDEEKLGLHLNQSPVDKLLEKIG